MTGIVRALGASAPPPRAILDLGCGTGVGGGAWALAAGGTPQVTGIDRHQWAVAEARWTYAQLGIRGRTRQGEAGLPAHGRGLPPLGRGDAVIVAYTLNELADVARERLVDALLRSVAEGTGLLIVEPIGRRITPWWDATAERIVAAGGRADEWKFEVDLPPLVERLDRAAGLDHRVIASRSCYCPARR